MGDTPKRAESSARKPCSQAEIRSHMWRRAWAGHDLRRSRRRSSKQPEPPQPNGVMRTKGDWGQDGDAGGIERRGSRRRACMRERTSVPCSFGHPVRARPSSVCIHACLSICNDLGLFSPRAARNRQGFGELPPKNARVRLGMRALLVVLGKKRSQRAEICRFMLRYQDIFVITKHSNARLEPRTRTRTIFGSK